MKERGKSNANSTTRRAGTDIMRKSEAKRARPIPKDKYLGDFD